MRSTLAFSPPCVRIRAAVLDDVLTRMASPVRRFGVVALRLRRVFQISAVLILCTGPRVSAATISVVPSSQSVPLGHQLTVTLQASGLGGNTAPSLAAYDIDLTFDGTLLAFADVTWGAGLDVLALGSVQVLTLGVDSVNLFELSLDGASDIKTLQPDAFVLATLMFDTLAPGTSPFALSILALADADGATLTAEVAFGSGTVTPAVSTVPEPSSLMLVVGGGGVLAVVRRRARAVSPGPVSSLPCNQ